MSHFSHILVVCPPENRIFLPMARAYCESFRDLGYHTDLSDTFWEGYDVVFFIVFCQKWDIPIQSSAMKIGVFMEPLPWMRNPYAQVHKHLYNFKKYVHQYDKVVCVLKDSADWLLQHNFQETYWCALGYHRSFEVTSNQNRRIIYPVSFIGNVDKGLGKRRRNILRNINRRLGRHAEVAVFQDVYDTDLADVIYNTNIHLNIHAFENRGVELPRIINLLSNRQFVMTEPVLGYHPFKSGQHLIEVPWQKMPDLIEHYLLHPKEYAQIAQQGYAFVKGQYNLTKHLQNLLKEIDK